MSKVVQAKWCVYQHITPNGKRYFGITQQSPAKRWQGGSGYKRSHFSNAVRKYGWDSIKHFFLRRESEMYEWQKYEASLPRSITNTFTEADAKMEEMHLIEEYQSHHPLFGYNRTLGGEGETPSLETRMQMSKTRISLWLDESFRSKMTGQNSAFWKGYDEPAFRYLDQNNNATLRELAEHVGCCETTAFALRQQWLEKNPNATIWVDRSNDKNPNYRGLDKKIFEYLDLNPDAIASQIQSAVGCDESTALKYRKQWRSARGITPPKPLKDQIYELLDENPEMMLKDLMASLHCCETTASKYRKQWQQDHPDIHSRRNQIGEHNPHYKGIEKRVHSYLDQRPNASLKEIMQAVSCGEGSAAKHRKSWRMLRAK